MTKLDTWVALVPAAVATEVVLGVATTWLTTVSIETALKVKAKLLTRACRCKTGAVANVMGVMFWKVGAVKVASTTRLVSALMLALKRVRTVFQKVWRSATVEPVKSDWMMVVL